MPDYLLELYLARNGVLDPGEVARGARRAAEQERGVRYVRSIVLPEEELCFHIFNAATPTLVMEAGSRLGMPFERVVEVLEVGASDEEQR